MAQVDSQIRTARCLCGAVRLSAKNVPTAFSTCYCKDCQRWVGGAYRGINVATDDISVTGDMFIKTFKSSDFAERANCSKCGSALWWRLTRTKYFGKTSISVGLLDDTSGLTLHEELFTDYKNKTDITPADVKKTTSHDVSQIIATFEKDTI